MLIGYARVSSTEQETTLQRDALRRAGVRKVFEEKRSAVKRRPVLDAALAALRKGDTLIVYKTDRVARSLSDLLYIIESIKKTGAHFRSLTEPFDTTSAAGELAMHILGAVAQFERALIRERSMAGQRAARERGATIGRPRALTPDQEDAVWAALKRGRSMSELARLYDVHLSSIKRVKLRRLKVASTQRRRGETDDDLERLAGPSQWGSARAKG